MSKRKNMPTFNLDAHMLNKPSGIYASGLDPVAAVENVAAEYREVCAALKEVGGDVKAYRSESGKTIDELMGRLQSLEQEHAQAISRGTGIIHGSIGPSIGTQALQALEQDAHFQVAAQAASRNQKIGSLTSRVNLDMSLRAALTNDPYDGASSGSYIPNQPERRGFVGPAMRSLRLLDVLPSRPVSTDSVEFIQLEFAGDASEQEVEGDPKAELDADGTAVRADIVTVAGWLPASRQVLGDHAGLGSVIEAALKHKCLSRLENRLVNGTGGTGQINGLINQGTIFVPTYSDAWHATTHAAETIGEAVAAMAGNGFPPNAIVLNPYDWFLIRVARDTEEGYLYGPPTTAVQPMLWNLPVVTSPSVAYGTALVLDTQYLTILDREQVSIMVSNSHSDFFVRNMLAILGELRAGLEVLHPSAIYVCEIQTAPSSA